MTPTSHREITLNFSLGNLFIIDNSMLAIRPTDGCIKKKMPYSLHSIDGPTLFLAALTNVKQEKNQRRERSRIAPG
jgi:hypothetical protein